MGVQQLHVLHSVGGTEADFDKILGVLGSRSFQGSDIPEARGLGGLFLGEPCWSPCYEWQRLPFQGYSEWVPLGAQLDVEPAVATYYWETGFDCSLDNSVLVHIPSCDLATGMDLRWVGTLGQYCSADGRVLALDPSIRSPGPSSLLARLEALQPFLADSSQRLMWALRGEKNVCSRDDTNRPGRLRIGGTYYLSSDGQVIGKHRTIHSDER